MSDLTGKTLGQYQIVELVQDTGSALIYKGFQPNMNRYVAVEVLKSTDPAAVQAFMQQNELLAQIQHPNILPIYDSGQTEGLHYRVTALAEGGVLQDHLMAYYDPGKAAGLLSGAVDKRTDVYALGVLLYTLLIGETPPAGVVVSPRAKRPNLPASVEKVILKAMAQNPEARFQSASKFQHALTAALLPEVPTPTSPPQTQAYQPPPPASRGTNWAAIILGVILVVVICGGIFFVFNWWSNRPVEPAPGEPVQPPVEVEPTAAPVEPEQPVEPPAEVEPPDDSVGEEPPSEPGEGDQPTQLPAVCSSGGFAGGFFILGNVLMVRKRSYRKRKTFVSEPSKPQF